MKQLKLSILFTIALMAGVGSAEAQTSMGKNAITYKYIGSDYTIPKSVANYYDYSQWSNWQPGFEVGYYRFLNRSFNVGFPFRLTVADSKEAFRTLGAGLDGKLIYKVNNGYLLKEEACIAPYLFAGIGGQANSAFYDTRTWDAQAPLGLGINLRLGEQWNFQVQSEYRMSLIEKTNNLAHSAGFVFNWGGEPDTDKDGIYDSKDDCPNEAGLKAFKGCPDTDGDGIKDGDDNCPNDAGKPEMKGCPDKDGDGIADKEDACPDTKGLAEFSGCPDSDGDKIADRNDACPNEAGLVAFGGCPDTDGDGIKDGDDKCPKEKGLAEYKGCPMPDRDKDGIADEKDKCPDVKGVAAFQGCADTDGDGIVDGEDKCPSEKGFKENFGCPIVDTDKDGLADKDDACPNEAGLSEFRGCPDKDGDKIADKDDKCPDTPGVAALQGCPEPKPAPKVEPTPAPKPEPKPAPTVKVTYIQFETSSAKIKKESYKILDEVVTMLKANPSSRADIQGHTDNVGDPAGNQKLSEARAKACLEYLKSKGVEATRLTSGGYGETNPIEDNKTAEGRAKNRRVEFLIFY